MTAAAAGLDRPIVIRPRGGLTSYDLREIWEFRELLWVLAGREIKLRYKQAFLGAAWAVIQPFLAMVVFSIFFGRLAGLDRATGGIPYPVFTFAALVPWYYFAQALAQSSASVVEHRQMLTKVYFPRIILPIAPVLAGLLDFAVSLAVLVGMMLWYGIVPTSAAAALPLFLLLAMLTALAAGFWLSALNALYRDFRYVIPFLLQIWLFASPVAYPGGIVPERWRVLYGLNPMTGVVEGFRWALFGGEPPGSMLWASAAAVAALLGSGLLLFRRMERTFVDVV